MKNKIAIIGAGAIGSLLGGILAREGEDVTLIGNPSHMKAIETNGLIIKDIQKAFCVRVNTAESLDFKPDIIFVAVKTQDVENCCLKIKKYVGKIPVIMMQNGVRSTRIAADILKEGSIISCIVLLNAQFIRSGQVARINQNPIVIGSLFNAAPQQIKTIQDLLNKMAPTFISSNIMGAQWSKLFINALGNSLDGMTGLPLGEYIKHAGLRKIGILILKEALNIVEKSPIQMEGLPGIPLSFFKYIVKLPASIAAGILKLVMKSKGDDKIITSTLQSLQKGKKTEIDYLNGEFVKLAEKNGLQAPYNSLVVQLIHEIEQTGTFFSPDQVIEKFSKISPGKTAA